MTLRDPSDLEVPPQFAEDGEVCKEHGEWEFECKLCYEDKRAESMIDSVIQRAIDADRGK